MNITSTAVHRLTPDVETRIAFGTATVLFAASRLVLLLVGWLTLAFVAQRTVAPRGISPSWNAIQHLACRWDCAWYMSIAGWGYDPGSMSSQLYATNMAFWPAFPYLARYLHHISGLSLLASGTLISNTAFLFCLHFLYKYCLVLGCDRRIATYATALLAFAPQSTLFSAFYGDSPSLLGVIGAMYYARTARWWLAGAFAILASSARPTGFMVMVFLLVHAYQALGWKNFLRPWVNSKPFIPVVLAPTGHLLAMWMAFFASGDAFAEVHTRAEGVGWQVSFIAPWQGLIGDYRSTLDLKFWATSALLLALSVIPLLKQRWWPDAAFAICFFLLIFTQHNPMGLLHYAILLPTIYVGFAWMLRHSEFGKLSLLGIFASVGAALCCAWTLGAAVSV
jgi:hypothetical protein